MEMQLESIVLFIKIAGYAYLGEELDYRVWFDVVDDAHLAVNIESQC